MMTDQRLSDYDRYLLGEGTHLRSYEKLGAHVERQDGRAGTAFAVWAPNAARVSVVGDFNRWDAGAHPMRHHERTGLWELFVPEVAEGAVYKYHLESRSGAYVVDKADPYGFAAEVRPQTASRVWDIGKHQWNDGDWMRSRGPRHAVDAPMAIYEVHLGSWRRTADEARRSLSYRESAEQLADYVTAMGFTHVELLPVSEHPFDGSWGYQPVGYFAPTSRFGTPDDFMWFVDHLHQRGVGVILDWVPAHFPRDEHGLAYFDGTHLFEHADPRQGEHPDWGTFVFNYGRAEVRNFLIANALFWCDKYHVDGLRVDAVASMLYLDYGRRPGEWIPNRHGGNENVEAIDFLRRMNEAVYANFPDVVTIAEESTAWPMVSRPTYIGGLGFGLKWNMGWMHDMLDYMSQDPIHRSYHHNRLTFSLMYAFSENFVLPFSHDEVVHGKGSMIGRMPGDQWQRLANLRLLYGYMTTHPGRKLLFMGCEFGQHAEWNHDGSLEWHLLDDPLHAGLQRWVRDLTTLYRGAAPLHELDSEAAGFEWIDCQDHERSVISFLRRDRAGDLLVVACNFTPVPRHNYRVGAPRGGFWEEILNSDALLYGGSGQGNQGGVTASPLGAHGRPASLNLTLPPLGIVVFRPAESAGHTS